MKVPPLCGGNPPPLPPQQPSTDYCYALSSAGMLMKLCLACVLWWTDATPLVLTTYLDQGEVAVARQMARVTPDLGNVVSYSGYFQVNENKTCGNHLFFWFFPAESDWENAPLLLWLQGGPGSSSMYGVFELNGPFNSFADGLKPRNTSWTEFANMIYIDNPVGAGYSFSTNNCYPHSIDTVVRDLYSALTQFFRLFPELQENGFFLTGESFAGHYIPPLGVTIDKNNRDKGGAINLKGLVMGNPEMDLSCHDYGSFLYQVGFADEALRDELYESQRRLKAYVSAENHKAAYEEWIHILFDLIAGKTGWQSQYTILTEPTDTSTYVDFLNTKEVRQQLHVSPRPFIDFNDVTYDTLNGTITQSFSGDVQTLLQTGKYVVAFYRGNMDIICVATSANCIMRGLEWSGQDEYLNATREIWYLNGQVVGWFKTAENLLLDILVKDAQHAAIYSQPDATYRMMASIVAAKPGQSPLWYLQNSTEAKED